MRADRRDGRRRRWPIWANFVVILLVLAIALAGAARLVRVRQRSAECETFDRLVESSRKAEAAGRLEPALAEIEAALVLARHLEPPPPELDELSRHRAMIARKEAEAKLNALDADKPTETGEPGRSIGQALTLLARAEKDPALYGMEDRIAIVLDQIRKRWAEADRGYAEKALAAGSPLQAMTFCVRMHASTEELTDLSRKSLRDNAKAIARRIIERHGVVIEPTDGQFSLGSAESYAALLNPWLIKELHMHGYLPRTTSTPWDDLWTTLSPFQMTLRITERQDEPYLSSQNRISTLDSRLALEHQGKTIWYEAPTAKTQIPLPGLPALQASRMATGEHRSAEFERLLYLNARDGLIGRLAPNLRHLPKCRENGSLD